MFLLFPHNYSTVLCLIFLEVIFFWSFFLAIADICFLSIVADQRLCLNIIVLSDDESFGLRTCTVRLFFTALVLEKNR